jgi:hypothetical protein
MSTVPLDVLLNAPLAVLLLLLLQPTTGVRLIFSSHVLVLV